MYNLENINIAKNIIAARGRANISVTELERRTGIVRRTLYEWESGGGRWTPDLTKEKGMRNGKGLSIWYLLLIANACGCTIVDLIAEDASDESGTG